MHTKNCTLEVKLTQRDYVWLSMIFTCHSLEKSFRAHGFSRRTGWFVLEGEIE